MEPSLLNNQILVFGMGALCLAAIYHTFLFIHRKDNVIFNYCIYLWMLFGYLVYRYIKGSDDVVLKAPNLYIRLAADTSLMMLTYITYIIFWGKALALSKKQTPGIWRFYYFAIVFIICYVLFENIFINNRSIVTQSIVNFVYLFIRIYLSLFGLVTSVYRLRQSGSAYYFYLFLGTMAIVLSGLFSVYVESLPGKELFQIKPSRWMIIGYFMDAVFFSAAIAVRLRQESLERIQALKKVLEQQNLLRVNELAAIASIFQARENERSRISLELHDDLGGNLSSIRILSATHDKNTSTARTAQILAQISIYATELLQKLSEIVWALDTRNDKLDTLIAYIRVQNAQMLEDAGISYYFSIPDHIPDVTVSGTNRRHLYLLLKEAVHNVIKHAEASRIDLSIAVTDTISICIEDNGKGLNLKIPSSRGNGVNNMNRHAIALNGVLEISAKNGTCLKFHTRLDAMSQESVN